MTVTETLGRKVLAGGQLTKKEAMTLYGQPLEELCTMADTVRARFHAQAFSLCTIVNGKSGRCTENCRFCAQSAHYHTEAAVYPLCDQEEILAQAKRVAGPRGTSLWDCHWRAGACPAGGGGDVPDHPAGGAGRRRFPSAFPLAF